MPAALTAVITPVAASYLSESMLPTLVRLTACLYVNFPFLIILSASAGSVTFLTFPHFIFSFINETELSY